jgi:hypothetical protein
MRPDSVEGETYNGRFPFEATCEPERFGTRIARQCATLHVSFPVVGNVGLATIVGSGFGTDFTAGREEETPPPEHPASNPIDKDKETRRVFILEPHGESEPEWVVARESKCLHSARTGRNRSNSKDDGRAVDGRARGGRDARY